MASLEGPVEGEGLEGFREETTEGGEGGDEDRDGRHAIPAEGMETELPFVEFVEEAQTEDNQKGKEDLVR